MYCDTRHKYFIYQYLCAEKHPDNIIESIQKILLLINQSEVLKITLEKKKLLAIYSIKKYGKDFSLFVLKWYKETISFSEDSYTLEKSLNTSNMINHKKYFNKTFIVKYCLKIKTLSET